LIERFWEGPEEFFVGKYLACVMGWGGSRMTMEGFNYGPSRTLQILPDPHVSRMILRMLRRLMEGLEGNEVSMRLQEGLGGSRRVPADGLGSRRVWEVLGGFGRCIGFV
jgi:hypothetical protein